MRCNSKSLRHQFTPVVTSHNRKIRLLTGAFARLEAIKSSEVRGCLFLSFIVWTAKAVGELNLTEMDEKLTPIHVWRSRPVTALHRFLRWIWTNSIQTRIPIQLAYVNPTTSDRIYGPFLFCLFTSIVLVVFASS